MSTSEWETCEHVWEAEVDSQFSNEHEEDVKCIKCMCPGSKDIKTGFVFWPAS